VKPWTIGAGVAACLALSLAIHSQDGSRGVAPVHPTNPLPKKSDVPVRARRALLIGNQKYIQRPLRNPIHDATDMADALRALGFDAELVTDASRSDMEKAVSAFTARIGPGDLGVFFYAGHGFQLDASNYLAPVEFAAETEAEAQQRAISFDAIKTGLERTSADAIVMILDSCRDNPFRTGSGPSHGLALMEAGLGSYIAFAASPGKTASDNPRDRNGLFTKCLLEHVKQPVGIAELFRQVRREVATDSDGAQRPYLHDQMIGDLHLSATEPESAQAAPPPPSEEEETAKRLYSEGHCEEAVNLLDRVVRTRPTDPFAQNALGLAYACLKMDTPAAERFSLAIQLKPAYAAAYLNRGNVFVAAAQYELAVEDFTWAIEQEPGNANFYWRRGIALFGLRHYEDARTDFAKAVELDPSDPHGYEGLGRVAHQMGNYREALQYYNTAIAYKRDFVAAYVDRARARERMGDAAGAAADRETAERLRSRR
jgi:Flp pilus assembly protein TadD